MRCPPLQNHWPQILRCLCLIHLQTIQERFGRIKNNGSKFLAFIFFFFWNVKFIQSKSFLHQVSSFHTFHYKKNEKELNPQIKRAEANPSYGVELNRDYRRNDLPSEMAGLEREAGRELRPLRSCNCFPIATALPFPLTAWDMECDARWLSWTLFTRFWSTTTTSDFDPRVPLSLYMI